MLARKLHYHPARTATGLAADLAAARNRPEFIEAENLTVAAAFDLSRYTLTAPSGAEPTVGTGAFPPAVPEATGPADRWWPDSDRAVLLRLRSWWTRHAGTGMIAAGFDHWTMWCFARAQRGLAWASARRGDIPGDPVAGRDWCVICARSTPEDVSCRPAASSA
jgi:hypothetical protein